MPGIVGLITGMPRQQAESRLLQMLGTLKHESFYETGTWIDEPAGIYVGWAVRKGSFCDVMPTTNARGDVVLVFSGEEFSDPAIVGRNKTRNGDGHDKPTSYLVDCYEQDPCFPAGLNGRFQGILLDRRRGSAMLFNDRYGMHRVYYHEAKDAFYFAAEAKAILAVCPELRSIDAAAMAESVACGCVLENRTLFRGIQVLPPASRWRFENRSLKQKAAYFQPKEWEEQSPLEPEPYYQSLREVFSRNLPRYFNGGQPVGVSLTAGLDTRMIMAWQRSSPGSLPCYSFGGSYRDSQDVLIARQVAAACQQPHEVIPVGEDFLARFPRYAERSVYVTDGCAGVDCSADLYVNERARQIAPVRMTGNYGGEVLRRVRAFKPVDPMSGLFAPELLGHLPAVKQTYAGIRNGHPLSFAVFRQAPWHHYALLSLEETQLSLRSPYLDNDFVRTVFRAPQSTLENNDISLRVIADGNPKLRQIRTDRGLAGNSNPVAAAVIRKFLEFTVKAEYAYDHGMPQSVARVDHCLSALHLERLFLGRHKFYHFRIWYRDVLSNYVREMLLDSRTLSRPYLQRSGVEAVVAGHLKGDRNYTDEIHRILTLELVHRLFVDAN